MPVQVDGRKVVVGTTLALGSAAALYWLKRRKTKPPSDPGHSQPLPTDTLCPSTSMDSPPELPLAKARDSASDHIEADLPPSDLPTRMSWSETVEKELALHPATAMTNASANGRNGLLADSPSAPGDHHSEASLDSGRGGSTGPDKGASPVGMSSPVAEAERQAKRRPAQPSQPTSQLGSQGSASPASHSPVSFPSPHANPNSLEAPPIYEFEIPQHIVGLIIGKKGVVIKDLTSKSGTWILIRDHSFKDNYKICTIEGTREQINACLRMIRRRFPPSKYPELNLNPLLPPPIPSPSGPWGAGMTQLSLPEGVSVEVVVSAMVDAGHVFVQQPTHPSFTSLTKLDGYMLAVYSQTGGVPPLPLPVELGVICAAPALGGWYRALTVDFDGEALGGAGEVLVKFVDYGGYSRLPAAELKQIRSDFVSLPFQATECYLANVAPAGQGQGKGWKALGGVGSEAEIAFGGWSEEAAACVEDLLCNKVVEARVHHTAKDGIPAVQFFATIEAPDGGHKVTAEMGALLVEEGHAVFVSPASSTAASPHHRPRPTPAHPHLPSNLPNSNNHKHLLPPPKPLLSA